MPIIIDGNNFLHSLPSQERTVLQQASVVGRLFWDRIVTFIQAQEGEHDDPQRIPLALTSLRNRELVYRHEESAFVGAVEYLFKHDVLREVTYESVIKRLRKTYHGLVADWLIANCGDRIGEYSGLIGEHLLLAGNRELAGEYFKRAGDSALASFANTEAERYYRQALEFTRSTALQADISLGLGKTLRQLVRYDEAAQVFRAAIELYKELGNNDQVGHAYASWAPIYHLIDDIKAWHICQEGLGFLAGSQASAGYAQLLAESGRIAWWRHMNEEARHLCQRAIEMGDRVGEVNVSADARITLAFLEVDIANTISIFNEVIKLSNVSNLLEPAARAHMNLGYIQNEYLIDILSSLEHTLLAAEMETKSGNPQATVPYSNALENLLFTGEIDRAEQLFSTVFMVPGARGTLQEYYTRVNRARILAARGEWQAALKIIRELIQEDQLLESIQRMGSRYIELALVSLELNRFGLLNDLTESESALMENIEIDHRPVQSHYMLCAVYARQEHFPEAADLILQPMDDKTFKGGENNRLVASRAMAQAELALVEECWQDAIDASHTAITVFKACDHKLWWARQLIDLGDAYLGRNEAGDLERARETYQQSLGMYTEMGSPGYIKVLEERLGEL